MKYEFGTINVNILFDDNGKIVEIYDTKKKKMPSNQIHAIGKKLKEAMNS